MTVTMIPSDTLIFEVSTSVNVLGLAPLSRRGFTTVSASVESCAQTVSSALAAESNLRPFLHGYGIITRRVRG
jgi:hypothetical protein